MTKKKKSASYTTSRPVIKEAMYECKWCKNQAILSFTSKSTCPKCSSSSKYLIKVE